MKKLLFCLAIVFCILFVNQYSFAATMSGIKKDAGYISLNASKAVEIEPNLAKVTFAIENTAPDAQKATSENNEISTKIITALKSVTSPDTDVIKTNNFSVVPVYSSTKDGKRVIKNYTAVNSITVETKNVKKIASFIDIAIANGANRTQGLYYSYESDKSVCNEIYPKLLSDLKVQADNIAKSIGTSVDGIKYINASCSTESQVSNGRFYSSKALNSDAASEEALSTPVEPGKVKVRVYVNADFYVK